MIQKERVTKNIIDVLGQLGGLLKILHSVFRILIEPINSFLFVLVMIKRLYFAKTTDDNVFRPENKKASDFVNHRRSDFLKTDSIPEDL